jgi:hypothetical protein
MSNQSHSSPWRQWLLMGLLLCNGCRSTRDTNTELLHNELRLLEDVIYNQDDEIKDLEQDAEASKRENELLRKEIESLNKALQIRAEGTLPSAPSAGSSHRDPPKQPLFPNILQKKNTEPLPPAPVTPELPKQLELELPAPPGPMSTPVIPPTGEEAPRFQGGSYREQSPYRAAQYQAATPDPAPVLGPMLETPIPESKPSVANEQWTRSLSATPATVDHITIHPRLTGGHAVNKTPGDDGILVVFAPRNVADQPLDVRGAISVVLVDPTLKARTARWEYTIAESARYFKNTMQGGDAYHLDLRWTGQPPQNPDQEVHVRFTTADGQQHTAVHDIILDLPGKKVAATESTDRSIQPRINAQREQSASEAPRWNENSTANPNVASGENSQHNVEVPLPENDPRNQERGSIGLRNRRLGNRITPRSTDVASGTTASNTGGDVRSPWNWRSWFLPDEQPVAATGPNNMAPRYQPQQFTIIPEGGNVAPPYQPGVAAPAPLGPSYGSGTSMAREKPEWRPYR